jgi:hypothetical protein
MITLTFGVNDIPYSHSENTGTVKKGKRKGAPTVSTTGEVAEILEEKYHIMETFWNLHDSKIIDAHSEAIQGAFEGLLQGSPVSPNALASGNADVEALFRKFLSEKEMDALGIPGVPTKASLEGVSHRFKNKKSGAPRPSFIDTGMYESSFVSEVE